jgi:predicted transcriptional regulator
MPGGTVRRGGAVAIVYDILTALKQSSLPTHIMQRANLSWEAFTHYREALLQHNYIAAILVNPGDSRSDGGRIEILLTRKGLELQRVLEQVFAEMTPLLETLYKGDGAASTRGNKEYVPAEERPKLEFLKVRNARTANNKDQLQNNSNNTSKTNNKKQETFQY